MASNGPRPSGPPRVIIPTSGSSKDSTSSNELSISTDALDRSPSSPPRIFSNFGSSKDSTSSNEVSTNTNALDGSPGTSKRRKTLGSITLNACTSCKKARAKCDGQKPACQRCLNRGAPHACLYQIHSKAAKDQMMGEINHLRLENQHLVQQNSALVEKNDLLESVVRSLKNDKQSHDIIRRLKRGDDHQSIVEWLGRPLVPDLGSVSPESEKQLNISIHRYRQQWVESQNPCYWTNVTSDAVLVEHLVTLYLTWIHPLHTLFDEDKFMASFRTCVDVYCSHSLVNAICAAACHVLRSEWRSDEGAHGGIDHLQSKFMDEVEELQVDSDASKMTAVQSWAIMFLVELGLGHGLVASAHLRHATESLMAKNEYEQAATSSELSSWGILTLTTSWSALIYQQPNAAISYRAPVFREVPPERTEPAKSQRSPSSDSGDERVDYSQITAYEQAKLHHIVHEILLASGGYQGRLSVHSMTSIYDRLLSWRRELPTALCNTSPETGASPHLLYLHIQYHVTVIQTLQPMLHLDNTSGESERALVAVIVEHAHLAFDCLVRYCETYAYHWSPIQLFCMVHVCDALIKYDSAHGAIAEVVDFALRSLEEARIEYPIANILRDIFRQFVAECHLTLPPRLRQKLDETSPYHPHDIRNALTRSTYQQPIAQMVLVMDASLGRDFAERLINRPGWKPHLVPTGRHDKPGSMQIGSLLN